MNKQIVEIELSVLERLEADSLKLKALEATGVDNWEGYDIAMDMLRDNDT